MGFFMYRILTAVLFLTFSQIGSTMDLNNLDPNLEMKTIIRTKLWYQGIDTAKRLNKPSRSEKDISTVASEELIVALDKLDSY